MYSALMLTIRPIYDSDTHEPIEHPSAVLRYFPPARWFMQFRSVSSFLIRTALNVHLRRSSGVLFLEAVGKAILCGGRMWHMIVDGSRYPFQATTNIYHECLRLREGRWTLEPYVLLRRSFPLRLYAYLLADDPRHLHPSIRNVISYPRGTCPLATSPSSSGYMLSFFVATVHETRRLNHPDNLFFH